MGAKFDLFKGKSKDLAKNAMTVAKPIVGVTGGVVVGQKFLDFKTLFPNMKPDNFLIKHEGMVKVGAVLVTLSLWKNAPEMVKWALIGIAVQGGIKAIRQYTTNDAGVAFINAIGAGDYNQQILDLAAQVKNATNEFPTGVGSPQDPKVNQNVEKNPAVSLNVNSSSGVAGMGMGVTEETEYFTN